MTAAARDDAVTPEAIEAAAEILSKRYHDDGKGICDECRRDASRLIVAALPALREQIAQEIADYDPRSHNPPLTVENGWGMTIAAAIVRKATPWPSASD